MLGYATLIDKLGFDFVVGKWWLWSFKCWWGWWWMLV